MNFKYDEDFLRIGYYMEARKILNRGVKGEAVDIGGNPSGNLQILWPYLNWTLTQPYPEFNVERMSDFYSKEAFDYAFIDQVLEHVRKPLIGLQEIYTCLQPGGWIYTGTPFLVHVHPDPDDFYRWTRSGLKQILEEAGFVDCQLGSWGNRRAAQISMQDWTTWGKVVEERGAEEALSIVYENDTSRPIVVFGKGRKPGKHRFDKSEAQ